MALTREEILGIQDIKTKEIHVPDWDTDIFIRKLTRGQQDEYIKRRFGKASYKQTGKAGQQVEGSIDIFGHDAWLVAQGVCDELGKRLFSDSDVSKLDEKSGEAIGFIALQILEHSGMREDISSLEEAKN